MIRPKNEKKTSARRVRNGPCYFARPEPSSVRLRQRLPGFGIDMSTRHKILLVDDNPGVLETYRGLLGQLPSKPEIHTANSGHRALAMLKDESYRLVVCDLLMPKMDGLQVLSIVRRKYPKLRTVALTAVTDEQFRARVYALGVDLFWHKPENEQEVKLFLECVESLLDQETDTGFRGVQSKSLVDIIQLECMSQSSAVLRITNGTVMGKIWIQEGEVIDAVTDELRGETAFQRILSWRSGTFETLAAEPSRARTIFKSYSGLLLESAQMVDEARANENLAGAAISPLTRLSQVEGLEFALAVKAASTETALSRGLENPAPMTDWARQSLSHFRQLGEQLHAGPVERIECRGPQRQVVLAHQEDTDFCVGWKNSLTREEIRERMKKVLALWVS